MIAKGDRTIPIDENQTPLSSSGYTPFSVCARTKNENADFERDARESSHQGTRVLAFNQIQCSATTHARSPLGLKPRTHEQPPSPVRETQSSPIHHSIIASVHKANAVDPRISKFPIQPMGSKDGAVASLKAGVLRSPPNEMASVFASKRGGGNPVR